MRHALIVAAVLLAGCKQAKEPEEPHAAEAQQHDGLVRVAPAMLPDLRISTAPVQLRPAGEGVTVLGELAPNEERYVEITPPVAAQVTKVLVVAGQAVTAGQPLAELFSAELGKAKAALGGAEARVTLARRNLERKRALAADGIVAPKEAQEAEADLAAAEAEADAARAELSGVGVSASEGSARFVIKAPIPGTVIDRTAIVGRAAEPGQPLFRIGDLSRLWLVVQGSERDAVRVRAGADAQVMLAALPGKTFPAKVALVGARVDPVSRTIPIRLELDNPGGQLRPGMSATALIPVGEGGAEVTTVPVAAVQRVDDAWYVFLRAEEEGSFERRAVGRGRTLGGEVEILSGLEPGEQVVVEGAFLLKAELEKASGGGEEHGH